MENKNIEKSQAPSEQQPSKGLQTIYIVIGIVIPFLISLQGVSHQRQALSKCHHYRASNTPGKQMIFLIMAVHAILIPFYDFHSPNRP